MPRRLPSLKIKPRARIHNVHEAARRWKGKMWRIPGLTRRERVRAITWEHPYLSGARIDEELVQRGLDKPYVARTKSRMRRKGTALPVVHHAEKGITELKSPDLPGLSSSERVRRVKALFPTLSIPEIRAELSAFGVTTVQIKSVLARLPHAQISAGKKEPKATTPSLSQGEIARRLMAGERYYFLPGLSAFSRVQTFLEEFPNAHPQQIIATFAQHGIKLSGNGLGQALARLRKKYGQDIKKHTPSASLPDPESRLGRARAYLRRNPRHTNADVVNALRALGVTEADAKSARYQVRQEGIPVPKVKVHSLLPVFSAAQRMEMVRGVRSYHVSGLKKAHRIRLFIQEHPGMGNKQIAHEFSKYGISEDFVRAVKSQTRLIKKKIEES